MTARGLLSQVADFIWPRICPVEGCGRLSDRPGRHVCSACYAHLPFYDLVGDGTGAWALQYAPPASDLIKDFKFNDATHLLADFADMLEAAVRTRLDSSAIDVVIPVPLNVHRLAERGYNQSALLARALAKRLDRRCDELSLKRVRDTEHQTRLSGEERRRNLRGAFKVVRPDMVRGRTVLLVDDVSTTGSTLDCCQDALEKAGAARVWRAALARRTEEA